MAMMAGDGVLADRRRRGGRYGLRGLDLAHRGGRHRLRPGTGAGYLHLLVGEGLRARNDRRGVRINVNEAVRTSRVEREAAGKGSGDRATALQRPIRIGSSHGRHSSARRSRNRPWKSVAGCAAAATASGEREAG